MDKLDFDIYKIKTPYYIIDEAILENNLKKLKMVSEISGCKVLLAQKAFSMFAEYPMISKFLDGTTASSLYEAKLGHDKFGKETHIFSTAYNEDDFDEILQVCDHVVFNSFSQWKKYQYVAKQSGKEFGLRINPEYSTVENKIYDPCAEKSRLGITKANFREDELDGITGLHFHTLCEQNSDSLEATVRATEEKFGHLFGRMKWINFGGGHHITRKDYDITRLLRLLMEMKAKYNLKVYLEPGEAVVLNAGYLVSTVLDIVDNGMQIAILDTSAACHMPDVLEMPYRPKIIGAGEPNRPETTYRLTGATCLAGDIIGDYSFEEPLKVGDKIVFCDMAHYSMVKNNTFNGMKLPSIAAVDKERQVRLIKEFEYDDFVSRLS